MLKKRIHVNGSKILVLGLTFKENCPDVRNTKVIDIVHELIDFGAEVDIFDPWVKAGEAQREYGVTPLKTLDNNLYDGIILAVAHREFISMGPLGIKNHGNETHVFFDLKSVFSIAESDLRL